MKIVIGLLLLLASTALAAYRKVHADGSYPYTSIQAAINDSAAGDTVNVGPGVYNENMVIDQSLVIVGAGWDTNSPFGRTYVNGGFVLNSGTIGLCNLHIWKSGGNAIRNFADLSITGCRIFSYNGSANAFQLDPGSSTRIQNCIIELNSATAILAVQSGSFDNLQLISSKIIGTFGTCYSFRRDVDQLHGTFSSQNCIFSGVQHNSTLVDHISSNCLFIDCGNLNDAEHSINYRYCAKNGSEWSSSHPSNMMVDGNAYDSAFHPTAGSPLIDAGDPNSSLDLDGSRADIGCYGGPWAFNDNGVANGFPFMTSMVLTPPSPEQGAQLLLESNAMIGPVSTSGTALGNGSHQAPDTIPNLNQGAEK